MCATQAQIDANRKNAQRSTGPKTAEGKSRSRQNALKHGLTATVLDPALEPIEAPRAAVDPADPSWQDWLQAQVGRVRVQIVRSQGIESKLRDLAAWRAGTLWDTDRRVEAEDQGAKLKREPARTVAKLRQTPHGCDWLSGRWQILARAAESNHAWTAEQTRLAFDLLGTPAEGRTGLPGSTIDPQTDGGQSLLTLSQAALADLAELRPRAAEADELDQLLAADDLRDTPTRELARLRRYELALHKRLQWLITELRGQFAAQVPAATAPILSSRNEATDHEPDRETEPTESTPDPILPPDFPRHRPDLTRLGHQNRRDRRRDQRQHRLA